MKKRWLLALMLAVLSSQSAWAENAADYTNGFYAGIKLGSVNVDEDEIDDLKDSPIDVEIDDAGLGGLQIGYRFLPRFSIEVDMASSEHDVTYSTPLLPEQDLKISTFGLYIAYRSLGQWYFKGRAGLISRKLELSPELPGQEEDTDGLLSIGFGGGVRIDKVNLEAEFTTIEEGVSSFGFVALYNF